MSSLRKNVLSRGNRRLGGNFGSTSPVKWSKYFDNEQSVVLPQGTFHTYSKGDKGPVLVTLHGGGYSALTWATFCTEIVELVECQILAIDLRGHGKSTTKDDSDLSLETLADDVIAVLQSLYTINAPQIIIVGHSMGGAIAVEVATKFPVAGLVVVDVVEGTALESLSSMQSILRGRPTGFKNIEEAIRWCYRSGMTHNLEAARVSVPGQIKNAQTGELAASEFERGAVPAISEDEIPMCPKIHAANSIAEEDEPPSEDCPMSGLPPLPAQKTASFEVSHDFKHPSDSIIDGAYTWRIDLSRTENFWNGWFTGLSSKFLGISAPKILLLANIQGLDTALTLGQMQGKYQLQVLSRCGHAIHEDQPHHVAEIIGTFLVKQRLTIALQGFTPIMPAC